MRDNVLVIASMHRVIASHKKSIKMHLCNVVPVLAHSLFCVAAVAMMTVPKQKGTCKGRNPQLDRDRTFRSRCVFSRVSRCARHVSPFEMKKHPLPTNRLHFLAKRMTFSLLDLSCVGRIVCTWWEKIAVQFSIQFSTPCLPNRGRRAMWHFFGFVVGFHQRCVRDASATHLAHGTRN